MQNTPGFQPPRGTTLNCPGCKAKVADGTSICPKCDYIIDASFISSEPPEADGNDDAVSAVPPEERTNIGPAPTAPPPRPSTRTATGARPSTRTRTSGSQPKPPAPIDDLLDLVEPEAAPDADATRVKSLAEVETSRAKRTSSRVAVAKVNPADVPTEATNPRANLAELETARGQRPPPRGGAPRRPPPKPAPRYEPEELDDSLGDDTDAGAPSSRPPRSSNPDIFKPEESLDDVRAFVGDLGTSDKLALVGAVGVLIVSFLPWVEHFRDGESMGYTTLGAVAAGCAALVLTTLVLRVRGSTRISPALLWLAQLGATSFGTLWCLIFLKLAYDGTKVPALVGVGKVSVSTPGTGAYFGLMCMLLSLGGALMGLNEKRS